MANAACGRKRRGEARISALLGLGLMVCGTLFLPRAALGATGPDVAAVIQFPPRPPAEATRCFASPITRTETIFWGATNQGDAPVPAPIAVELTRIHPNGTSTRLSRETVGVLAPGETILFQFPYPVTLCVTADPRLPWPNGGRFRVTVDADDVRRTADALDP